MDQLPYGFSIKLFPVGSSRMKEKEKFPAAKDLNFSKNSSMALAVCGSNFCNMKRNNFAENEISSFKKYNIQIDRYFIAPCALPEGIEVHLQHVTEFLLPKKEVVSVLKYNILKGWVELRSFFIFKETIHGFISRVTTYLTD